MPDDKAKPVRVEEPEPLPGGTKAADAPPKGGGSGSLVVMIVGFLVMILTPLTSYFIVKLSLPAVHEEKSEAKKEGGNGATTTLSLEPMLVNIAETKGTRILRIVPHLVLSEAGLSEKLAPLKPMLTDEITTVASGKTIDELDGPRGRENLKKEILSRINVLLEKKMAGAVVEVYFGEFLIQ